MDYEVSVDALKQSSGALHNQNYLKNTPCIYENEEGVFYVSPLWVVFDLK